MGPQFEVSIHRVRRVRRVNDRIVGRISASEPIRGPSFVAREDREATSLRGHNCITTPAIVELFLVKGSAW
jgi:hypothetical protein